MKKPSDRTVISLQRRMGRVLLSSLFGTLFYLSWLGVYLASYHLDSPLETAMWPLAPLVTGLGFFLGIRIFDRRFGLKTRYPLLSLLLCLLGCTFGAFAVYWFGPMLIVFAMLVTGALSVTARELILWRLR